MQAIDITDEAAEDALVTLSEHLGPAAPIGRPQLALPGADGSVLIISTSRIWWSLPRPRRRARHIAQRRGRTRRIRRRHRAVALRHDDRVTSALLTTTEYAVPARASRLLGRRPPGPPAGQPRTTEARQARAQSQPPPDARSAEAEDTGTTRRRSSAQRPPDQGERRSPSPGSRPSPFERSPGDTRAYQGRPHPVHASRTRRRTCHHQRSRRRRPRLHPGRIRASRAARQERPQLPRDDRPGRRRRPDPDELAVEGASDLHVHACGLVLTRVQARVIRP
jgi:hypothetical protein